MFPSARLQMAMATASVMVFLALLSACAPTTAVNEVDVRGTALAGPTCPVETIPPQPGCEERPVAGAVLVFQNEDGSEIERVTTEADGTFVLTLAPGVYHLVPQPVEGLMGVAPEQDLIIVDGQLPELTISYDTGIR